MSPNEQAADGAQNATTDAAGAQNATDAAGAQNATDAATQGPSTELPDAAPDFVGEIHATINDFLGGGVESLGEAVSGVAANGMAADAVSAAADVAMALPV